MYKKLTFIHEIFLIGATSTTQDAYANEIEIESETKVFADIRSVYAVDFYNSAKKGLKPQFVASIHDFEYSGQSKVKFMDKYYKVERAFNTNDGIIELTCSEVVDDG